MKRSLLSVLFVLAAIGVARGQSEAPKLMRNPVMNASSICFAFAGDLWSVSRSGGDAVRLTTGPGEKSNPRFSPDGKWIAFTGQYGGNSNVFVMPASGGTPRQITFDPGADDVEGWTPDGKNILCKSSRDSHAPRYEQLYTVPVQGGFATTLPLPMGYEASYSSDGTHLAYTPLPREIFFLGVAGFDHAFWAHYHGGLASQVWIADLADSSVVKVPHENSSDFNPMWIGDKVYFLSARTEPISLFAYDTAAKKISEVIPNRGVDIMSASAGPGGIVYEQFGSIHIYDFASGREHSVNVNITGDFPEALPHFEKVAEHVMDAQISPTGARAVFEAHGEILTVPAENGSVRNLTNSPAVADRSPAWSPDGKWIAYFSDESGEYALHIMSQDGEGKARSIGLGQPPAFYFKPVWSPDSKKIAYTDQRLNLWYVDLDNPSPVKIDTDTYFILSREMNPVWSPDSRWIAYARVISNRMRAIFVYSPESGKTTQVTDGLSDAEYPAFDKSGKYLYFAASTDSGPTGSLLDMTSNSHRPTRSIYLAVLAKKAPSPFAARSDEEKTAGSAPPPAADAKGGEAPKKIIGFEGPSQRILGLPLPPANYTGIQSGKPDEVFIEQSPAQPGPPLESLIKFSLATRQPTPLISGIQGAWVSFDGNKFLYKQGEKWGIASTAAPAKPGDGLLAMDTMEVWVQPRDEWKQMFHEIWRIERDYFYASNLHGLNLEKAQAQYSAYVPGVESRQDLNYLFREMLGQISVGHMFVGGGDIPKVDSVSVGLLGADYSLANGRYRFAKIYNGENWNPGLRAPLTEPGLEVKEGDYLLAVNGRDLHDTDDVYSFFLNTANKQVSIRVGPNPDASGSREVAVVPIPSEIPLRHRDWVIGNVRKADEMSGGKVAYVYLPDTGGGGYASFNRYFFAQINKQGVIIDDRFNSGGQAADYIIEYLQRKLWNYWYTTYGSVWTEPGETIFGPKALLINQYGGSGGDLIPWFFHHVGLGPLIGERTWGGEVGILGYPELIDGGTVTAPSIAFFSTEGKWAIENEGVPPDIEVEMDPKAWREGHDLQLERAVQSIMDELKAHPLPSPKVPPFPNYFKNP